MMFSHTVALYLNASHHKNMSRSYLILIQTMKHFVLTLKIHVVQNRNSHLILRCFWQAWWNSSIWVLLQQSWIYFIFNKNAVFLIVWLISKDYVTLLFKMLSCECLDMLKASVLIFFFFFEILVLCSVYLKGICVCFASTKDPLSSSCLLLSQSRLICSRVVW